MKSKTKSSQHTNEKKKKDKLLGEKEIALKLAQIGVEDETFLTPEEKERKRLLELGRK